MISVLSILNTSFFLLAICLTIWNINERFNTNKTTTFTNEEKLDHILFPLKFTVLVNPGFDLAKLKEVGYSAVGLYISGKDKWGGPHIGWAGHTEDGSIIGNVSGKLTVSTTLESRYAF